MLLNGFISAAFSTLHKETYETRYFLLLLNLYETEWLSAFLRSLADNVGHTTLNTRRTIETSKPVDYISRRRFSVKAAEIYGNGLNM